MSEWLEPFEVCFAHVAQRGAFRRYLLGLLSDSGRKSMSAMLERVSDPGTYQSFQHFITHAPWRAERVWRQLRARIAEELAHAVRTHSCMLDGEVCCVSPDGRPNFKQLLYRREWPVFYSFDVLSVDGTDLTALPLLERKRRLRRICRRSRRGCCIWITSSSADVTCSEWLRA